MVKKPTNTELVTALKRALEDEAVVEALASRIVDKLADMGMGADMDPVEAWRRGLKASGVKLDKDVTPERAAELYPLAPDEVKRVADRLRTEKKTTKPMNLERLREMTIQQLGDDELMYRAANIDVSAEGGRVQRRRRCTGEYECGHPFHCGHEVSCGFPYEYLPCGPLYEYACRPKKSCRKPYMCGVRYKRN
jgi:hypothetical protein